MKKVNTKELIILAGVAFAAYAIYEIGKAISAGVTDIGDIIAAPFTALKSAASAVGNFVGNLGGAGTGSGLFGDGTGIATPAPIGTPQQNADATLDVLSGIDPNANALNNPDNTGGFFE